MVPEMYRIRSRSVETPSVVTLTLTPTAEPIAGPAPGQFTMLWAVGVGEAPISLAGRQGSDLVHTVRPVGAVTRAICDAAPGGLVGVRGPFGFGWDIERAAGHDVLVVAGGLGVAPIRPLVQHVLEHRDDFGRVAVLIGARAPDELLYRTELDEWASRRDIDVQVTVDVGPATWRGHVGLVTDLLAGIDVDPARTVAFICGPEIMMRFAAKGVIDRGVSASETFVSLERNMHCAIGHCGHCQLGPLFLCKDGPVVEWATAEPLLSVVGL
jgi:NAD(P)H-flavin reductase